MWNFAWRIDQGYQSETHALRPSFLLINGRNYFLSGTGNGGSFDLDSFISWKGDCRLCIVDWSFLFCFSDPMPNKLKSRWTRQEQKALATYHNYKFRRSTDATVNNVAPSCRSKHYLLSPSSLGIGNTSAESKQKKREKRWRKGLERDQESICKQPKWNGKNCLRDQLKCVFLSRRCAWLDDTSRRLSRKTVIDHRHEPTGNSARYGRIRSNFRYTDWVTVPLDTISNPCPSKKSRRFDRSGGCTGNLVYAHLPIERSCTFGAEPLVDLEPAILTFWNRGIENTVWGCWLFRWDGEVSRFYCRLR